MQCEAWSVKRGVWSDKCGVWSMECGVWSGRSVVFLWLYDQGTLGCELGYRESLNFRVCGV